MLKGLQNRMKDDKGFTLIELMVVVLIIGILLAIAIPTFLRVRRSAQDKAAMSSVQDAVKAAKAHYVDNNAYTNNYALLDAIEPSIQFFGTGAGDTCAGYNAGPKCVEVEIGNDDGFTANLVTATARSESGTFWAMKDIASGANAGTYYNTGGGDGTDTDAEPSATQIAGTDW